MTKEKAEQWLKEVTGRKIKWGGWGKDRYFISTGRWIDKTYKDPYLWKFEGIDENNDKDWYRVCEGFSENKIGECWEYVEDFEAYLELLDL